MTKEPHVDFVMREALLEIYTWILCLYTSLRIKQVEFNPYIYTLSKLSRFGYEISVFNTVFRTATGTAGVVLQTIPLQNFPRKVCNIADLPYQVL